MYPSPEYVETFISRHAAKTSIERSRSYLPLISEKSDKRVVLACAGSGSRIYRQVVDLDENGVRRVSCSCPYDGGGICKHAVAALRVLAVMAQMDEKRGAQGKKAAKSKAEYMTLPLSDGLLDFAAARLDFKQHGIFHHKADCAVTSYEPGNWGLEVRVNYMETYRQTLQATAGGGAVLKCSCEQAQVQGYCTHGLKALNFAAKNLGANCLAADFLEKKTARFLKGYGLTLNDDYSALFEFGIDRMGGLEVRHKVRDLMGGDFALPEYTAAPQTVPKVPDHGLALVLDFSDGRFVSFTPVIGRYNKQGELAVDIKELPHYGAADVLYSGKLPEWCGKAWYAVAEGLQRLWSRFADRPDAQKGAEIAAAFERFLKDYPDMPLFAHPDGGGYKTSYARRNIKPLHVSDERVTLEYSLSDEGAIYRVSGRLNIGGRLYAPDTDKFEITPCFVLRGDEILLFADPHTAGDMVYCTGHPSIAALKTQAKQFQTAVLEPLSARHKLSGKAFVTGKKPAKGRLKKADGGENAQENAFAKQVYVREEGGAVRFEPMAKYPGRTLTAGGSALILSLDEDKRFHITPREEAAEQAFLADFQSLHPAFAGSDGRYLLTPAQLLENDWFFELPGRLKQIGAELLGAGELKSFDYAPHRPTLSLKVSSGTDWFDLDIGLKYGEQSVDLKTIRDAFSKQQNYVLLSDGRKGILPAEWMARLGQYFQAGEIKKDRLRLSKYQFGIIDGLYQTLEQRPEFLIELYQRRQRLLNLQEQPDITLADGLNATLRPYQQQGLNWLAFLHANRLGGCLADDMGLGKTLQTIAFLHHLKTTEAPKKPSLIVAPSSLVFNWQNEIARFCPGLSLLDYTGAGRLKDPAAFAQHDIVLTTYGTLMQDIGLLKDSRFHYLILDESQAVKNPLSQRYKAVRLIRADNRLILSGTPVENNTFDLYAQFDFINPGLLGSRTHFKKTFSDPIDKHQDPAAAALLAKIVHPFILRRTKAQVAAELPEKTENVIYCEMGEIQRQIYEAVKQDYRERLMAQIQAEGIAKSQIHILEGLTRLRQICNSPELADGAYGGDSVKLDTLIHIVKEKTGRHKILIFSQFVKMLGLIAQRLDAENISYEYLDGQTRNRGEKVARFQQQQDLRVFLISTKAGGTGLNLTEADYVFIVDPWWNPAVENQAIDRSHRIGQRNPVTAYRLICRNSVEEKIHALQQRKQHIADSIISVDEGGKSFDLNEVKNLFA